MSLRGVFNTILFQEAKEKDREKDRPWEDGSRRSGQEINRNLLHVSILFKEAKENGRKKEGLEEDGGKEKKENSSMERVL